MTPNQAIVEGMVENCVSMYNDHEADLAKLVGVKARTQKSPGGGSYYKQLKAGQLKEPDQRQVRILSYRFTDMGSGLVKAIPKWEKLYNSYKSYKGKGFPPLEDIKRLEYILYMMSSTT